jgi:hypothetical protein
MVEVSAWTSSLALTSLIYYPVGNLREDHFSVVLPSRYVLLLQKDENGMEVPLCEHLVKTVCTQLKSMVILKLSSV